MKNKIVNFAIGAFIGLIISLYAVSQRAEAEEQPVKEYPIGTPVVKVVQVCGQYRNTDNAYFEVPLSHDIQDHIFEVCEEYGIAPALVIAMIAQESGFRDGRIGDGGASEGLMQVQRRWHQERMDRLGCDNLLDPYQNITVAVDYIAELKEINPDLYWVLMAYNSGMGNATKNMESGNYSEYAVEVTEYAAQLERRWN